MSPFKGKSDIDKGTVVTSACDAWQSFAGVFRIGIF